MQEQRVFVVVVVAVALVTTTFFLFSTFSSSLVPIRRLILPQDTATKRPQPKLQNVYNLINHPQRRPSPPRRPSPQPKNQPPIFTTLPHPNHHTTSLSTIPPNTPLVGNWTPYISYDDYPGVEDLPTTHPIFKDTPTNVTDEDGKRLKVILYWNEVYGKKHFGFGFGREPFLLAGCRVNTCIATGDRTRYPLSQVDAVLWHFRSNDKSLPKKRYPHTRYIFWMMESASYLYGDLRPFKGVFNMTFTYRRDSDIYSPYGMLFRRRHPLPLPPTPINYAKGKTRMAAWFVSNCNAMSGREKLVDTLKTWIKVDIYGNCGQLVCEKKVHKECLNMLGKEYKFYLSFENSLCEDYVTEKFFGALRVNVVPVVWGLGNYEAIAPPHSYIDALSFASVHDLAKHLLYLDAHDDAYNEYFRWKRYYHQTFEWVARSKAFCDLCEKLHRDDPPKAYNMKKWFEDDSRCLTSHSKMIKNYIHGIEGKP